MNEKGIRIPEEVSLTGMDNLPAAGMITYLYLKSYSIIVN